MWRRRRGYRGHPILGAPTLAQASIVCLALPAAIATAPTLSSASIVCEARLAANQNLSSATAVCEGLLSADLSAPAETGASAVCEAILTGDATTGGALSAASAVCEAFCAGSVSASGDSLGAAVCEAILTGDATTGGDLSSASMVCEAVLTANQNLSGATAVCEGFLSADLSAPAQTGASAVCEAVLTGDAGTGGDLSPASMVCEAVCSGAVSGSGASSAGAICEAILTGDATSGGDLSSASILCEAVLAANQNLEAASAVCEAVLSGQGAVQVLEEATVVCEAFADGTASAAEMQWSTASIVCEAVIGGNAVAEKLSSANLLCEAVVSGDIEGAIWPLTVSTNGRFVETAGGMPYPLFIDSGSCFPILEDLEDVGVYIADRAARGFTAVILTAIHQDTAIQGSLPMNINGDYPFTDLDDWSTYDPDYWDHVEAVLEIARDAGLAIMFSTTFFGSTDAKGWHDEIISSGTSNMAAYGAMLGARFSTAKFPNIIWAQGGDRAPGTALAPLEAMISAMKSAGATQLQTALGAAGDSSLDDYPSESWVDLNIVYEYVTVGADLRAADAESPRMAMGLGESEFEGYGASRLRILSQAYWSILSAGCLIGFGNYRIWRCYEGWELELDEDGSLDTLRALGFFERRSWWLFEHDATNTILTAGGGSSNDDSWTPCAQTSDGVTTIVFAPTQRTLTIDMSELGGSTVLAWWYDTYTDVAEFIGEYSTSGSHDFVMPQGALCLVLDDAAAGLGPPGIYGMVDASMLCECVATGETSGDFSVTGAIVAEAISTGNSTELTTSAASVICECIASGDSETLRLSAGAIVGECIATGTADNGLDDLVDASIVCECIADGASETLELSTAEAPCECIISAELWSVPDITDIEHWWTMENATESGGRVVSVSDPIGSLSLTQSTPADRLYYNSSDSDYNGKPSADVNGAAAGHGLCLLRTSGGAFAAPCTEIFVVCLKNATYSDYGAISGNFTTDYERMVFRDNGAPGGIYLASPNVVGGAWSPTIDVPFALRVDWSASTAVIWVYEADGSSYQSGSLSVGTATAAVDSLLAVPGAGGAGWPGSVFERIVTSSIMPDADWDNFVVYELLGRLGFS